VQRNSSPTWFVFGSFVLFTNDRFLALRAYELLVSDKAALQMSIGVIRIDDMPIAWRNLSVLPGRE
jgi:hypothetical protein